MRIKMLKGAGMRAKRKIEIRKVSRFGIWITLFLALAFVFLIIQGENEFFALNESTEQYIQAEKAVQQFFILPGCLMQEKTRSLSQGEL